MDQALEKLGALNRKFHRTPDPLGYGARARSRPGRGLEAVASTISPLRNVEDPVLIFL